MTTTVTASAENTASHPEFPGVYADEPVDSPDPDEKSFIVGTDSLQVIIRDCPLRMTWQRRADDWVTVSEDRPTGAYEIGTHTGRSPTTESATSTTVTTASVRNRATWSAPDVSST